MGKRGQQEIAGFVIIVVLVVVAAFIFMVLSAGNKKDNVGSMEVSTLLDALWDHTTECIVREPLPLSVGGLIDEAYGMNPPCKDMGKSSKEYLNETIYELMNSVLKIEPRFSAYQLDILDLDEDLIQGYFRGNCDSLYAPGTDRIIPGKLRVVLRVCLDVDD